MVWWCGFLLRNSFLFSYLRVMAYFEHEPNCEYIAANRWSVGRGFLDMGGSRGGRSYWKHEHQNKYSSKVCGAAFKTDFILHGR